MESTTNSRILCYICQSGINVEIGESSVEIFHKFQIYATKFLDFSSCLHKKSETNQLISNIGDDDHSKNKFIPYCIQCATEAESFCEMWESLESLQAEMICAVVNISNLTKTKHKFQSKSDTSLQSPRHCIICESAPGPMSNSTCRKSSESETCLKFMTFVTRFVINTEKPSFDKKILQIFVEMGNINIVFVYCCDICLTQLVTFCEMYEAMDSLRLEILRILDKISNRSKHFQSCVENCRRQSFPRVNLERLPSIDKVQNEDKNNVENREFPDVADLESDVKAEGELQLDDDYFDSIETISNGIPSPSWSLHDNNNLDNTDTTESAPAKPINIFQTSHVTMNTKKRLRKSDYKNHVCAFCEKKLSSTTSLETHMHSHTGERVFVCRFCSQEYSTKYVLLNHRRSRHFREENAPPPKVCEICGKSYEQKADLIKHVQAVHEKLKLYNCDICGKGFSWKTDLKKHHQNVHANKSEPPHSCDICEKSFWMPSELKSHKRTMHDGLKRKHSKLSNTQQSRPRCRVENAPTPKTCEICRKSFDTMSHLNRHVWEVHEKRKPHRCDICGKAFFRQSSLQFHRNIHADRTERPYTCDICGKTFSWNCSLKKHKRDLHENIKRKKPKSSQRHSCDICGKTYSWKCSVNLHKRAIHKDIEIKRRRLTNGPSICEICGKSFSIKQNLTLHVQSVHQKLKPHKCDICGQMFGLTTNLTKHKRAVHDGIKLKRSASTLKICEICGKSFSRNRNLNAHVLSVHQKLKPYKCETCGKMFASRANLRTHKRCVPDSVKGKSSNKEICHLCGKTVSSYKNYFLWHLNEHHRSEIDDSLKIEKKFKCTVADCSRAFYENHHLRRHILTHTGERSFQCDQCGKAFSLQYKLRRHKECHKDVRPHVCAHCGKGFNYKYRLTQHLKKYHNTYT